MDKSDEDVCEDHVKTKRCNKWKNQGKCNKNWVAEKCPKTCGFCSDDDEGSEEEVCEDILKAKRCNKLKNKGKCSKNWVAKKCAKTCGFCEGDGNKIIIRNLFSILYLLTIYIPKNVKLG